MTPQAWKNTLVLAWHSLPPARRLLWGGLLTLAALALGVQLWLWPTRQRWQAGPAKVAAVQNQWQSMSAMAQSLKNLPADAQATPVADATAVQALLQPHWGEQAQAQRQGGQLHFTLRNLSGTALAQGMQALQSAGWRTVQAQLQNSPQGWSGQMVWQP